ncbi:MAG: 4a-hydroxytetrahydrobiopterin dehydratase [Pseudomonadota bacterium]
MKKPAPIDPHCLGEYLDRLDGWNYEEGSIVRSVRCRSFRATVAMMCEIALLAERFNHHPDWRGSYLELEIRLTTHAIGGLSALDFKLAEAIDRIACYYIQ